MEKHLYNKQELRITKLKAFKAALLIRLARSWIFPDILSIKGNRRYAVASWNDPLPFAIGTIMAPWIFWNRKVN